MRQAADLSAFALCYVKGPRAYFTTQKLSEQWGDDWNDAPYEHNAGTPYYYSARDSDRGIAPWEILKVAFDGDFQAPCDGHVNSPWSVEKINSGAVPWVSHIPFLRKEPLSIYVH